MQEKWFVIINPAAAQRSLAERVPQLKDFLRKNLDSPIIRLTERKGHATFLAKEAIEQGFRKIIAVGGDGTNHEVVNGILMQNSIHSNAIKYTLLPLGTGNDWAKYYKIPKDWNDWIAMVNADHCVLQDVGHLNYVANQQEQSRYFTNVAGLAYDGFVVSKIEKFTSANPLFYLWSVLKYLLTYKPQSGIISFDNQQVENTFYTINIGICRYSGGGMQFAPHAIANDGKLALTIARKMHPLYVLASAWMFFTNKVLKHPRVQGYQVESLRIESTDTPILLEADGEFLGQTPVDITIKKETLCVICPASSNRPSI